jgi:hypothetical protein
MSADGNDVSFHNAVDNDRLTGDIKIIRNHLSSRDRHTLATAEFDRPNRRRSDGQQDQHRDNLKPNSIHDIPS